MQPKVKKIKLSPNIIKKVDSPKQRTISVENSKSLLSSINRKLLDFDFEKVCSVTLQKHNLYCCLVCGKFFQGRGSGTPAYSHSLDKSHYIFLNMSEKVFYSIPENKNLHPDPSLSDILYNLDPSFSSNEVKALMNQEETTFVTDIFGSSYLPGFVGMNQVVKTDYINVNIYLLAHIPEIKYFFLKFASKQAPKYEILNQFSVVIKKIWSNKKFKASINPHQFIHSLINSPKNKLFSLFKRSDSQNFFAFLLSVLSTRKFPLKRYFEGTVRIKKENSVDQKFYSLSLDLPDIDMAKLEKLSRMDVDQTLLLNKDKDKLSLIPEVELEKLLMDKFSNSISLKLIAAPKYLVINIKRFKKNNFFWEKNPTIVKFPLDGLDLTHFFKKQQIYKLISIILHESPLSLINREEESTGTGNILKKNPMALGRFKVQLRNFAKDAKKVNKEWFEIEDLRVTELMPQQITLGEVYTLVYQRGSKK
eukprot:maker-scaffold_39-snap-gene-1.0-mRNA-1 protein AED:0.03 eAED:0.04 QI:0/0/0/1/1/1/2/0/476